MGTRTDVAGLAVRCRPTRHVIPTVGLLLESAEGTLGWSSDTAFEREHVDWLAEADIIVHEAGDGPWHTPVDELASLPPRIRERLRLIHLPDAFDRTRAELPCLAEGEVVEVTSNRV